MSASHRPPRRPATEHRRGGTPLAGAGAQAIDWQAWAPGGRAAGDRGRSPTAWPSTAAATATSSSGCSRTARAPRIDHRGHGQLRHGRADRPHRARGRGPRHARRPGPRRAPGSRCPARPLVAAPSRSATRSSTRTSSTGLAPGAARGPPGGAAAAAADAQGLSVGARAGRGPARASRPRACAATRTRSPTTSRPARHRGELPARTLQELANAIDALRRRRRRGAPSRARDERHRGRAVPAGGRARRCSTGAASADRPLELHAGTTTSSSRAARRARAGRSTTARAWPSCPLLSRSRSRPTAATAPSPRPPSSASCVFERGRAG